MVYAGCHGKYFYDLHISNLLKIAFSLRIQVLLANVLPMPVPMISHVKDRLGILIDDPKLRIKKPKSKTFTLNNLFHKFMDGRILNELILKKS